jgi:hypothetical protein
LTARTRATSARYFESSELRVSAVFAGAFSLA